MSPNTQLKNNNVPVESEPTDRRAADVALTLHLDHVILRSPDPASTLATLEQLGLPVISPVQRLAGGAMQSGVVNAGPVDIEVLRRRKEPAVKHRGLRPRIHRATTSDPDVSALLRALGLPTSAAIEGRADADGEHRRWRVVQVADLLPDPFPVPFTTRPPRALDRIGSATANLLGRIPAIARAAARNAGSSVIVITEYDFDTEVWRTKIPDGPRVVEVETAARTAGSQARTRDHQPSDPRLIWRHPERHLAPRGRHPY